MVVAYGLILPKPILEAFPLGCFNLHASLLPRWRGAAPIQRAIMAGDRETGVMVMKMEEGLDTGPIAMAERVPIGADATAGDLHDALARRGADLMVRALAALERGSLQLTPQPEPRRHLRQQDRQDRDAHRLDQAVAGGPRPLPRAVALPRRLVRVGRRRAGQGSAHDARAPAAARPAEVLDEQLTIACGEGAVRLVELQRAGRQPMRTDEFLRGTPIARACVLS